MRIQVILEIDEFDEHSALECVNNLQDSLHIMYNNHAGDAYYKLPVKRAIIKKWKNDTDSV